MAPGRALIRQSCAAAAVALLAAACENTTITPQSFGAVVTVVDSGPALRSARTFVLPDTVMRLSQTGSAISHALANQLVAEVRSHFVALGWIELPHEPGWHPDVVVLLAASTQVQSGLLYSNWFSSWGYLPYWGAAVDPTWLWGFPGEVVPYSYQTGTLVVSMLDVRAPRSETKTIPLLWAAGLDGLVGDATTMARIHDGITQAFDQSPYLRQN